MCPLSTDSAESEVPHEGRPVVFTKATNKWSYAELSFTQAHWAANVLGATGIHGIARGHPGEEHW